MTWISVTPQILTAACLLLLPGGLLAFLGFRLRGLAAVAVSPVLSISLISVSAVAADLAGVPWSLLPVAVLTVLATLVVLALRVLLLRGREQPVRTSGGWAVGAAEAAAVVAAALLVGRRLIFVFGSPENFSQTFDNIFHLNAVQYIADTASASSLTIGQMTGIGFYPAGWHGLVSLVQSLAASPIPVSVNAVNLVIGALVWPLGCIFLVQQVAGRRIVPTVVAGVLSAAFGAFPLLLLDFGVLYPNFLGVSLVPSVLALVIGALGLARRQGQLPVPLRWILLLLAVPGLGLGHPSAVLAVMAFSVPLVLAAVIRRIRAVPHPLRSGRAWLHALGFVLYGAVVAVVWNAVRPAADTLIWKPYQSQGQAIGEVLSSSPMLAPVSWAVLVLSLFGLAAVARGRAPLWVAGIYGAGAFLFVVASSSPDGDFRDLITGGWYTDNYRLAALLPTAILPVAAMGATLVVDWLDEHLWQPAAAGMARRGRGTALIRATAVVAVAVVALGLAYATQKQNVRDAALSAAGNYQLTEDSPLVSRDEYELIERLDGEVEEGAAVVGNPWTGSSLVYALAGYRPLQLHTIAALDPEEQEVYADLRNALSDPGVCPALEETGVEYVLDFGTQEVHGGAHRYPGLEDLDSSGAVTLVDQEGDAKLYRISACG